MSTNASLRNHCPGRAGWTVIVGASLETYDATMSRVTTELVIGCSLFVILAAAGSYLLARSALRPVERLRAEVSDLSVRDIPGTLAVPRTHDEISALASTMNELLVRVRTSLERERSLVADASHELRTPFAILQGELELAQRPGRTRDELMAAVTVAAEEVARLTRIADDLLLLSRGDQGQLPILPVVVGVRDYLEEIMGHAEPRITGHGMTCRVDAPSSLRARLDPDRMRQVVDNLIDNSLRYCPAGSVIEMRAGATDQDLWLEVVDDGPGFRPELPPTCVRTVPALGHQPVPRPRRRRSRSGDRLVDRWCPWRHGHRREQACRRSLCPGHTPRRHLAEPLYGSVRPWSVRTTFPVCQISAVVSVTSMSSNRRTPGFNHVLTMTAAFFRDPHGVGLEVPCTSAGHHFRASHDARF